MEHEPTITLSNPYEKSNFISRLFFFWLIPFFRKGYRKDLEVKDLYICPNEDRSTKWVPRLEQEWNKELIKKHPDYFAAVFRTFRIQFFSYVFLSILSEVICKILQSLALGWLIEGLKLDDDDPNKKFQVYGQATLLCVASAVWVLVQHTFSYNMQRQGMQLRVASCGLLYRKALRLSRGALGQTTVGQMVNLLSNDVNRFDYVFLFLPYFFLGPIQCICAIGILWPIIGRSCLSGIAFIIILVPLQIYLGRLFSIFRRRTALRTDERVRLMSEIVTAIRVIKMYTWEKPFAKLMDLARRREIAMVRRTAVLRAIIGSLFFIQGKVVVFVSLIIYLVDGGSLSAYNVFVTTSLFNAVRMVMGKLFPFAFSYGGESLTSLKRLEKFLLLEERVKSENYEACELPAEDDPKLAIRLIRLDAAWSEKTMSTDEKGLVLQDKDLNKALTLCLKGLNFKLCRGQSLAVVGPVGSGKSSLLMAILGELPLVSGRLRVHGRLSYASQEPWIFSGSVKENILFGTEFNLQKYRQVVHACALERDFTLFPHADETVVGDRGASLSGGQKARINLARALYRDADIYLLDDPLSAVDANVAKHIFEKCVKTYLKDKTVILVTHQLQFIRAADQILVLEDGRQLGIGTFEQLSEDPSIDLIAISAKLQEHQSEKQSGKDKIRKDAKRTSSMASQHQDDPDRRYRRSSSIKSEHSDTVSICDLPDAEIIDEEPAPRQERFVEMSAKGSIKAGVYWRYLKAGGSVFSVFFLISLFLVNQIIFTFSDWWLSQWSDRQERVSTLMSDFENLARTDEQLSNLTMGSHNGTNYSYDIDDYLPSTMIYELTDYQVKMIFTGMVLAVLLISFLRTCYHYFKCLSGSIDLHGRLFESAIHATVLFFDTNPIGALLNRASRDMGIIDDILPTTMLDAFEILLQVFANIILVILVDYWVLIPTVGLTVLFVILRRFYIGSARGLKRLEGLTRSPVFGHLSVSLYGLSTLRAFKVEDKFSRVFDYLQDNHTSAWYLFISSTRWFAITLDWISVIYIAFVTWFLILIPSGQSRGEIGLAISSALMLTQLCQWGVRQATEMESQMTSVERVLEYTKLPAEADFDSEPDKKPPPKWPSQGKIEFKDVILKYDPNDAPVLKGLSFVVQGMEKIGIVGRTGAGKSSLISVLFRLNELSGGQIFIDGIDVSQLGLHDLRGKISIIPQEPVLFTGPLRRNIDPFSEHSDERLWEILDEVQLKDAVQSLSGGLDAMLSEGGSNFSVGQRQLICLARALVRNNRILVLDEATANVDTKTDGLIQQTIREKFSHCTILTVAHRLNTVMDSDRILVLDAGSVSEFDSPYILLQNPDGALSNLVRMTGRNVSEQLINIAKEAYVKRKNILNATKSSVILSANGSDLGIETKPVSGIQIAKF